MISQQRDGGGLSKASKRQARIEPGVTIQFNQMDITDLRSDVEGGYHGPSQRMLKAVVYEPDEVRALLEAVVE